MGYRSACRKGSGARMTDLKTLLRLYHVYLLIVAAVIFALFVWWICRGQGGSVNVGKAIDAIKTTTEANERRADAIVDAAKAKESEVVRDVTEKVSAANSDDLPDLLAGLLSEYRAKR